MYAKSLVVFFLCTAFVLAFYAVLNYEAAGVGNTPSATGTAECTPSMTGRGFSITSGALRTINYTSELGPGSYVIASIGIYDSDPSPITSIHLCVGSVFAGTLQGPFEAGVNRVVNLTLPETISVSKGTTYVLNVEGFYGNGLGVWESVEIAAE